MGKNNETTSKKLTFWSFLNSYSIEIPVIQRDYAWGREDKKPIRKKILNDIREAIKGSEEKLLDHVYGSIENGRLQPLDGQQRLTTLWLLHWYIALLANRLNEDCPESSEICGILRKFTYETRVSSREFCGELCDPKNFKSFDGTKIAEFIRSQTWFHSSWEQDPTISAMLTMLGGTGVEDGIEEVFNNVDFEKYWGCLTNDLDCPIKFLHQPLHHFGLSDDLYVKMNARGKPLTSFECFKADLVGYINKKAEAEKEKGEWGKLSDLKDGIPIKMDTTWTDIFWKNKSKDCSVDEIYFTFLNRFFMNYRIMDLSGGDEYYEYFNNDTAIVYSSLDDYKWKIGDGEDKGIDIGLFKDLSTILNNYYNFQKGKENEDLMSIFECPWGKKIIPFEFIPTYEGDNVKVAFNGDKKMIQRVVFYAVCKYFQKGEAKEESFRQWMRFVWNLVSVRDLVNGKDRMEMKTIDYINDFEKAKEAIDIISQIDSHNTYKSLCDAKIKMRYTVLYERFDEEEEKARQIEEGGMVEEVIRGAEKYSFFQGGIGFLFRGENGSWDWESFLKKWENVQKYFMAVVANDELPNDNLICLKENNAYLLRTLISFFSSEENGPAERGNPVISLRGDTCKRDGEWDKRGKPLYNDKVSTWRYLLNNKAIYGAVHRLLMGDDLDKIEIGRDAPNQHVLWMLSQTRLLDYVIKIDSKPLRYRVSGDFEAFFNSNNSVRIFMGSIDEKNKPFEQSLKYIANIEESKIKEIYDKGHFICQVDYNKEKKGWGDAFILVPEDEGNEIKSLEEYEEWCKEHNRPTPCDRLV